MIQLPSATSPLSRTTKKPARSLARLVTLLARLLLTQALLRIDDLSNRDSDRLYFLDSPIPPKNIHLCFSRALRHFSERSLSRHSFFSHPYTLLVGQV